MTTIDDLTDSGSPPPPGTGNHSTHPKGWHLTDDAVVCEFGHKDPKGVAWEMLAYGLEYVARHGKNRLVLLLPKAAAEATSLRAALLEPGLVEVWRRVRSGALAPVPIPGLSEAIRAFGKTRRSVELRPDPSDTSNLPSWALELGDWVESRAVERVRTDSYWSWHFRGREVLKITPLGGKTTTRHRVTAGVKFSGTNIDKHGDDTFTSITVKLGDEIPPDDAQELRRHVDAAIDRRRTKLDDANREHMLQGRIGEDPSIVGMRHLRRELAAGRPTGTGLIDFLGIDDDGGMHVIETKLGHNDHRLGLQGLDYWAWVTAHVDQLRSALHDEGHDEVTHDRSVNLRYVIGVTDPTRPMHAAARATIGALRDEIPWRVQILDNWNTLAADHTPLSLIEDIGPQRDRVLP